MSMHATGSAANPAYYQDQQQRQAYPIRSTSRGPTYDDNVVPAYQQYTAQASYGSDGTAGASRSPSFAPTRFRTRTTDAAPVTPSLHEPDTSDGSEKYWEALVPPPPINGGMYSQSNISAPQIDGPGATSSRGPPLADDLGFDKLSIAGSRGKTSTPAPTSTKNGAGMATNAAVERANTAYANQEIYQSAAEIPASGSLNAIAAEVDQTAAEMNSDALMQQHHAFQQRQQTGGGYMPSDASINQTSPPMGRGAFDTMHSYSGSLGGHQQHQQGGGYNGATYAASQQGWGGGGGDGQYYDDGQGQQYAGYDSGAYASHQQPTGSYFGGMGNAHAGPSVQQAQQQMVGYATQPTHGNPYMTAAQGFLDYPGATSVGGTPYSGYGGMDPLARNASVSGGSLMPGLARQGTQLSMASARSSNSALASRRRSSKDAGIRVPQQTLPFNKAFVDEYRHRMKKDPDPEAQFAYARYLIEAAKKVVDPKDGPKQARKYRDNLLSESLKLVKRLATTGMGLGKPPYAEAQFFLANCFGNGSLGLQVDHEKAYNLYVQASKQNHAAATYRTAVCNEVGAGTRRDHHRAVLFYRKASALGDTAGMYKLGMILLNGLLGQPRNIREAIVWLKRAAGQADEDNPHALHELGLLYEKPNNNIVQHDEGYARELFTQAAQLGYAPSQFKLGSAYEYGTLTCPVDPRRSIAWYTKAAGKSDGESELALSGWYLTGSEGVLKQSDSEAYLWARRAATKGIPKAEYAVGYYSEVGIGVEANIEEAKRWYMRAAAQGNKRAMMRLTELKQQKDGRGGRKGARPTRKDAEKECVIA